MLRTPNTDWKMHFYVFCAKKLFYHKKILKTNTGQNIQHKIPSFCLEYWKNTGKIVLYLPSDTAQKIQVFGGVGFSDFGYSDSLRK